MLVYLFEKGAKTDQKKGSKSRVSISLQCNNSLSINSNGSSDKPTVRN